MIKIIRRGEMAPSRRVQCHKCGCVFEYQKNDMQMLCNGGRFQIYLIECPQCGENLKIDEWDNKAKIASDASIVDLKTIKKWCDEHAYNCMGCPLNDECTRMFSHMTPNIWQDSDIEAFEKEIKE